MVKLIQDVPLDSDQISAAVCKLCRGESIFHWPFRNLTAFASLVRKLLRRALKIRIDHIICRFHTTVWAPDGLGVSAVLLSLEIQHTFGSLK